MVENTKATPQDGFGNTFGNKGVVSLQTLVIPIDLAERTGLEPATLGVTGRYSNQLNYRSKIHRVTQHHTTLLLPEESGVPRGIRTPVLTVKG